MCLFKGTIFKQKIFHLGTHLHHLDGEWQNVD